MRLSHTFTAGLITGASFDSAVAGSVGRLLPCVTAKIVDGDGHIVPIGSPGELLVKGPQVCLGYLDNPAATGEALDNEGFLRCVAQCGGTLNSCVFVRTGDLVIVNEHGDIFVKERLKQIINPAELEGHILGHPFVQDVGVIGRPDERAGEVPVAFITLSAAGRQAAATSVSQVEEDVKLFVKEHKVLFPFSFGAPILTRRFHSRYTSGSVTSSLLKKFRNYLLGRSSSAS
ncbi:acetyl-CoA synthetase-like protein [Exidia glandulosa HHB12029]|uniref:Acetyl-CoA synthetase-like protein n=1 Tax=Exidia glandulosa HHB12029 TaxID=1314781 RepID=A0A166NLZ2_EXIGL|nr:acetyl-CoA synthetase-like protein [Exidia glandulosa HHB12029]